MQRFLTCSGSKSSSRKSQQGPRLQERRVFDWAKFRRTKGAVKLHLVLYYDGYLPCYAVIAEGSVHDVKIAWQIPFQAGTVVVDDRGYNDCRLK